jgi:hypothetical protein
MIRNYIINICFMLFYLTYKTEVIEVSRAAAGKYRLNRICYSFWILLDLKGDVN